MAARIVEGLFTCRKRWALEAAVAKSGHRWRAPAPMCAAECVARILCWLDDRGDPKGRIHDATDDDVELAAGWVGKPGALVEALVSTGWVDRTPAGMEWHDYGSLNRLTLTDRLKKLDRDRRMSPNSVGGRPRKRGDQTNHGKGDQRGDQTRDRTGDQRQDQRGASESESGDPFRKGSPGQEQTRPGALRARAQEPRPEPTHVPANAGTLPTLDPRLMWSPERKQFVPRPGCEAPPKRVSTGGAP